MGLFDQVVQIVVGSLTGSSGARFSSGQSHVSAASGVIENGPQKKTGGHDHRYNTGDNRTPAQKAADKLRAKKNTELDGEDAGEA
jgi:hypothetical protein